MTELKAPANDNHGKRRLLSVEIDWLFVLAIPVAVVYWWAVLATLWGGLQWLWRLCGFS